jgi:hypothetical protein
VAEGVEGEGGGLPVGGGEELGARGPEGKRGVTWEGGSVLRREGSGGLISEEEGGGMRRLRLGREGGQKCRCVFCSGGLLGGLTS